MVLGSHDFDGVYAQVDLLLQILATEKLLSTEGWVVVENALQNIVNAVN